MPASNSKVWSALEIQSLLAIVGDSAIQNELDGVVRNEKVFKEISQRMALGGFERTYEQCRVKLKKLKGQYRKIKGGDSSSGNSAWRWYDAIDDIYGRKPAIKGRERRLDSATVLSESKMDSVNETLWLPDEVQVLVTLWAQSNIQKQLLTSAANNHVFTYLSNELALVGFNKTPQQCSLKVNKLKEEYKKMKRDEPHGDDESDWFAVMDAVLGSNGEASKEMDISVLLTAPKYFEADCSQTVWTSDEVNVLLTQWALESIQEQLRSAQEDERVYAQLSSELATQGFDKTTSQCKTKIRLLKQEYERIKEQKDSKTHTSRWFAIMDHVLGRKKPKTETIPAANIRETEPASRQASQDPPSAPVAGCHLSVPSLCLLVPTLRLMCAFAWQVVQCCNVQHYRKVEELVELVTELAPELLTPRERVQLLLRLRARLVLELCRSQSTANLLNIQPHLRVIQSLTIGSSCGQEELEKLESSKSNFVEVVHALLKDTEERRRFFMEVFPVHYGQQYEVALHRLVWKFISRLDNLLPVPDIKQTAEWLSTAPSVMEECGQLVLQPEQLKTLMHFHDQQSGSTNRCSSEAQNMFLPELSIHPKANTSSLASEQQEAFTVSGNDDGQYDHSKGAELLDENQTDDKPNLEDSGGNEDPIDDQCEGKMIANCHVVGPLQPIREEHLIQDSILSEESGGGTFLQNVDAEARECNMELFQDVATSNSLFKTHGHLFQCDKCVKTYASKSSLIVHYRIHTGETPFLCSYCGQSFRSSASLDLHLRIHTGERPHKCHICGKTSVQHLARHMRMHRGEKNYLCTECGKAFLSAAELKLHTRYHTGERPYTCKHCGKGFIAKCYLTVHTRRHTGESPYRCSMCPKSFPTLRAQKKHLKIHMNKNSFQCFKCGKIFRQEDTFKLHVETHDLI